MERYTYRTEDGEILFHPGDLPENEGMTITQLAGTRRYAVLEDFAQKFAGYEDAEEQGLLLRLPCKVGDAVYQITNGFISEYEITSAVIYPCNILFKWVCTKGIYKDLLGFNDFEISKTVFLTREEAEAKLKEMEDKRGE